MSQQAGALARAEAQVADVRDDPAARLALMAWVFHGPTGRAPRHLPFRRAALSFMRWQARRGVLDPLDASPPGSAWWRAVNERLLRDGCETIALLGGGAGQPSSQAVRLWLEFSATPTGHCWYRAHNASIVGGYLEQRGLADAESATGALLHERRAGARAVRARTGRGAAPRAGAVGPARSPGGRSAARDDGSVPLAQTCAPEPLSARRRRRALCRRRAAPGPDARLRGDRPSPATPVRVVRAGTRRTAPARVHSRRQPGLRLALRGATGLALSSACRSQPACLHGSHAHRHAHSLPEPCGGAYSDSPAASRASALS